MSMAPMDVEVDFSVSGAGLVGSLPELFTDLVDLQVIILKDNPGGCCSGTDRSIVDGFALPMMASLCYPSCHLLPPLS